MRFPTSLPALSLACAIMHAEPTGTALWLIQRVAVTTDSGVIGILPGTKVTVVKDNGTSLSVTDGSSTFDVQRAQLTTDIAVARKAASADYAAQVAIASATEKELATAQKSPANDEKMGVAGEHLKAKRIIGHVAMFMPRQSRLNPKSKGAFG